MKHTPGVDMSTGSLGQGISAACGMALAGKIDNADYRVYSILGDGELEEGQVWEAAMFAGFYKLNNLTAFVDFNGLQIDGDITKVLSPLPIPEKFKAFNWNVIEVNGHDLDELHNAIETAKAFTEGPTCIIMHTVNQQRNYKHSAVIFGPTPLTGRDIDVPDLRGGFSHLIAALAAKGPSNVQGISLIDRGYADFRGKLEALGADFD